ncbi:MAG TPA: substrate-binding domain-containing protein [Acidobacteriaceae bacterium]
MSDLLSMRLNLLAIAICVATLAATAQEPEDQLPHYVPHAVPSPAADAPYLLPDKTIYVLANDLVGPYFEALDDLFTKTHSNIRIHLNPLGSEPAIAALTSNISAFTPMGRDGIRQDLDGFKALHGYEPQSFLVGYDQSPDPDIFPPGKVPSAVWINAKNPLPKITVALAARIFTTGAPGGDITHWSQLGVKGEWSKREIHVYLPAKRDSAFLFIDGTRLGGRPWSSRVEWVDASTDVMTAIAEDPFGIGIIGFWPPDSGWDRQYDLGSQAKLLPMAEDENSHYSHATVGDVYPLTGSIRVYFNAAPGEPLEPWMREYMRLALSKEGQELLKSLAAENGYIALEPAKARKELEKLR